MSERVTVRIAEHVAVVMLERPEKHNALDAAMFTGILEAAAAVRDAPGVRAVVLRGAGPSFCSGLDVASFLEGDVPLETFLTRDPAGPPAAANLAQRACTDWIDLPVPVIAALHGNVFGGGLQIALGADIRIVAPDARLSIMEARWGLVPDMGITATLPRLLRLDVAKELTYTARVVSGTEAVALGLATREADDPAAAALALATEIAAISPGAVRAAKELYGTSWSVPVDGALARETALQGTLLGSPNQLEAVAAGMARRPPAFEDY